MITHKHCDLLTCDAKYICHQVNCQGKMGAGLAKAIAQKWPAVKMSYETICKTNTNRRENLLGLCQFVKVEPDKTVVNIFGQLYYGREPNKCYTWYSALQTAFQTISMYINKEDTIAFPYKFGCGLAGGDWGSVYAIIEKYLGDYNVIICEKDT